MHNAKPAPMKRCDLVMKGGVTSGVVYPMAVVELSKEYRCDSIGGTSAGAIAAVVTAAAEYGRAKGGFEKVAAIPDELSTGLLEKFEPYSRMRPLFNLVIAGLARKPLPIFRAAALGYWPRVAGGASIGGLIIFALAVNAGSWGFGALGVLLSLIGASIGLASGVLRSLTHDLPEHDYGMCPGIGQRNGTGEALTDWMCRIIDDVAGLAPGKGPLTVGHLSEAEPKIRVQTVTTDLTSRRPFALPIATNTYAFSRSEFLRIFPEDVVTHMVTRSAPVEQHWNDEGVDLYYFQSKDIPVVVLARMSLSFPGLISAVPLWRIDHTLRPARKVRCLFSDGGLSSNFPVHFFDEFLPHTPTFGISLGPLVSERVSPNDPSAGRITLPTKATQGQLLPAYPIDGLAGFIMAMFNTAKDWQDSLQSILPGYRERTVTVNLTDEEGGMNLTMPSERIAFLTDLGKKAGRELVDRFDLDEHRWRRYLTEVVALDEAVQMFARNYTETAVQPGATPFPDLAANGTGGSFKRLRSRERSTLMEHAEVLAKAGETLAQLEPLSALRPRLPSSRSETRNRARMDS